MKNTGKHVSGVHGTLPTHGHTAGRTRSPEFMAWDNMVQRCTNPAHPSYKDYGGRGIKVAIAFLMFENFLDEVGTRPSEKHSLERVKNNKGYVPGNIQWAIRKVQQRNRRTNRLLTYKGRTQSIAAWAEELGREHGTISSRLRYGWTVEKALASPLVKSGRPRTRPRIYSKP